MGNSWIPCLENREVMPKNKTFSFNLKWCTQENSGCRKPRAHFLKISQITCSSCYSFLLIKNWELFFGLFFVCSSYSKIYSHEKTQPRLSAFFPSPPPLSWTSLQLSRDSGDCMYLLFEPQMKKSPRRRRQVTGFFATFLLWRKQLTEDTVVTGAVLTPS